MQIVGLEPNEVLQDYSILSTLQDKNAYVLITAGGKLQRFPFFASANGVKWRNESFLRTIQEYRAQHPDAIFIIYAGNAHINTRIPFAITPFLDTQKTFVINLLRTPNWCALPGPIFIYRQETTSSPSNRLLANLGLFSRYK